MHAASLAGNMQALVICINYHSEADTEAFVSDLLRQKSCDCVRVVVVDNSERLWTEPRLALLGAVDDRVKVLNARVNLGYFGAAAWGLRQYLSTTPLPDWVIISNADISLRGNDFFIRLFELYPDGLSGVIAPSVISMRSQIDHNPFMERRPTKTGMHFRKWVFRSRRTYLFARRFQWLRLRIRLRFGKMLVDRIPTNKRSKAAPRSIYAPHGAFIIFHRGYFESGGTLNHGVFLFGEEIFVAEAVRALGLSVRYEPRLIVCHQQNAATDLSRNPKLARYAREASAYCANTFFP
jgi:GT2 family glycosyltransferase